jgi:hypothetical protein
VEFCLENRVYLIQLAGCDCFYLRGRRCHSFFGPLAIHWRCKETARLLPIGNRDREGIDIGRLPPPGLVSEPVNLTVMNTTERNRELIGYFSAKCAPLSEPQVMRFRRLPSADGTRLFADETQVLLVAEPAWFHQGESTLVDP